MNAIQNAAKKSKRKSMENIIGRKLSAKSNDGFDDNLSQNSEKSTDSKKSRRRLLENVQDSFKSMFSITSPRSTGSRSPGPGNRSPKSDSGSGGHSGRRSPILSKLQDVFHTSPRITVEEKKEIEKFNFDNALTIVGDSTELKKFNDSFLFSHRLDILDEQSGDSKSSLFQIQTKEGMLKVQIANISTTEELDEVSNKYTSIEHHSYIILHSEEVDDHFETWMDIIGSYGLAGNLIVVYENGGSEMKKKEKKLAERFVLSYVKCLTIDYSGSSKLVDVEKCLQKALKNNSPFNNEF
jgi:hypothetical protein